jgi:hypothetical protein
MDYEARFGADSKKAKGSSKGNWVEGRSGEIAERAGTYGMEVDAGGSELSADGYYDPTYDDAGMGGGTLYDGADELMDDDEYIEEDAESSETGQSSKSSSKQQMSEPIFPREAQQTSRKLF